jgi:hypothetical protein
VSSKSRCKPIADGLNSLARHQSRRDAVPRVVVNPSQSLGAGSIGQQEATDSVHLPELHRRASLPAFPDLPPPAPRLGLDDAGADQAAIDRRLRQRRFRAALPCQLQRQPARTPVRPGSAHLQHLCFPHRWHLVWAVRRPMGAIVQTFKPFRFVPCQPGVHRLPADSPILCHLAHRATVRDYCQDRLVLLLSHAHFPHVRECQDSAEVGVKLHPK